MEPTNREIVEGAYAGLARGDREPFLGALHPDVEWRWPRGMADTEVFRGREEVVRGLEVWEEAWADFRMELVDALERDDAVLAVVRYRARGRASDAALDESIAHLWEFREGRLRRMRMFGDVPKAKRRFRER